MVVVDEEEIRNVVFPEIFSELYGALKVTVVAATDCAVDDTGTLLADVGILTVSDAENAPHRSDVEPALYVIHVTEFGYHRTVSCNDDEFAWSFHCRNCLLEVSNLSFVKQSDVTTMIELSVEEGRVDLGVPNKA